MRGISWLAERTLSFSRRTLLQVLQRSPYTPLARQRSLIRNVPNKIEHVLTKTQTKDASSPSQWNQRKYTSQFALRSTLVCILWTILLFFWQFCGFIPLFPLLVCFVWGSVAQPFYTRGTLNIVEESWRHTNPILHIVGWGEMVYGIDWPR
jgi:hypothetical protein